MRQIFGQEKFHVNTLENIILESVETCLALPQTREFSGNSFHNNAIEPQIMFYNILILDDSNLQGKSKKVRVMREYSTAYIYVYSKFSSFVHPNPEKLRLLTQTTFTRFKIMQSNLYITVTLGDRYTQGDRFIQVSFQLYWKLMNNVFTFY